MKDDLSSAIDNARNYYNDIKDGSAATASAVKVVWAAINALNTRRLEQEAKIEDLTQRVRDLEDRLPERGDRI